MTEVDARDLGILDWFIATVRERAGLRPLRTGERLRAWDFPPAPLPPGNTIRDASGVPMTRPLGPPPPMRDDVGRALALCLDLDEARVKIATLEIEVAQLRARLAELGGYR